MKEVVNISLSSVSFSVEKDAYQVLESYIEELKEHYGEGEIEVVADIEERISELLIERGCNVGVVQMCHVEEIIKILGRPNEIEEDITPDNSKKGSIKKGIYRDTQNGIVAGVCSGLGAYFNLDAVWVRILFIVISFILTSSAFFFRGFLGIQMSWLGLLLLIYVLLWIIIPEAKTVSQRCAMRGESTRIEHIHKKFAQGARDVGSEMWQAGSSATESLFSTIWRVITFGIGVLLIIVGFMGIVSITVGVITVDVITGLSVWAMPDFIELNIGSTLWLKIFGILTLLLPFIGMLYGGINLTFKFKSPKWRPGLILFLVWLVSALVFILSVIKAFKPYYNTIDYKEEVVLSSGLDTLYLTCPKPVEMNEPKVKIDAWKSSFELFYLDEGEKGDIMFATYPEVKIVRQADSLPQKIVAKMVHFTGPSIYDEPLDRVKINEVVTIKDSLVTIRPSVYSKGNKFDGKLQKLKLYLPESMVVILKEPIEFNFNEATGSYHSGI